MYDINNKAAAIRHIQHMLNLNENGIYDNRTRKAVEEHQKSNYLVVNGVVDYLTFLSILNQYRLLKLKADVNYKIPFENNFPYSTADRGEDIVILNSMLRFAVDKLNLNLQKPRGPFYSSATERAVRELRTIFMLEDGDYIDEVFYDRLLSL